MKARSAVLAAFVVFLTAGLSALGGSRQLTQLPLNKAPKAFQGLFHPPKGYRDPSLPYRFAPSEVAKAFAQRGIQLQRMPTKYGSHVVVLFDPKWHEPTNFQLDGRGPTHLYIWVFVHATSLSTPQPQTVGNVFALTSPRERQSVNAALRALHLREKQ